MPHVMLFKTKIFFRGLLTLIKREEKNASRKRLVIFIGGMCFLCKQIILTFTTEINISATVEIQLWNVQQCTICLLHSCCSGQCNFSI